MELKTPTDEAIIAALMVSGSVREAAEALSCRTGLIYERLRTPEFKILYDQAKTDVLRKATSELNTKLSLAIKTISEIATDTTANPQIRLQACQTLLTNAARFAERLEHGEGKVTSETQDPMRWNWH